MISLDYRSAFRDFSASGESLRVYRSGALVFSSRKDRLLPLVEYIEERAAGGGAVIFDKIVGNAAALLSVVAGCREIWSPLGSEQAIATLRAHGIGYRFDRTVPFIQRADGEGVCPMERLSAGREPNEFYQVIRDALASSRNNRGDGPPVENHPFQK